MADIKKVAEYLAIGGAMLEWLDFDKYFSPYLDGGHHRIPKPKPTNRLSDDEIRKRKAKAKRRRK